MANRKVVLRLTGCLVVLVFVLGLQLDVMSMDTAPAADGAARPDLIMIDAIAQQEPLELPAVQFLHDQHVSTLQEQDKDCFTCHKKDDEGRMALAFQRVTEPGEELPAAELKKLYHDGCISCHAEDAAKGREKVGPQVGECRSCHVETPAYTEEHVDSGMDNVLHYRHWDSKLIPNDPGQDTNCGACHHQYDAKTEKLVYVKYEEEGCTTCHTDTPQGDVKTDRVEAFHEQCVTCHLDLKTAKAEKFGPLDCAGCHGQQKTMQLAQNNEQVLQKLGGELPRLPRKQPDVALLTISAPAEDGEKAAEKQENASAMPVAFNHKLHEMRTDSCADCHHETMKSCVECHTVAGKEEGGFVSLEEAMHDEQSTQSCAGCHAELQKAPECAGCHGFMESGPLPPATSCNDCHIDPASVAPAAAEAPEGEAAQETPVVTPPAGKFEMPASKEAREKLAAELVAQRPDTQALVAEKDIPEIVKIDALADKYKASEMPHRKIVLKLVENMKGNSLAAVFHDSPVAVCQGCHHNSPPSATPPSCQSCHTKPFQEGRLGRPGLKAAYHAQCMDCHEEMELEKPAATDCTACHEKNENG